MKQVIVSGKLQGTKQQPTQKELQLLNGLDRIDYTKRAGAKNDKN